MQVIKKTIQIFFDLIRVLLVLAVKPPKVTDKKSVGTMFEDTVAKYSKRKMIVFEGRELSWGEFNMLANRMARRLKARGVSRGDSIALIMDNRIEFLALIIATQKLGVAIALINPSLRGAQLAHCIKISGSAKCLIGEEVYDNLVAIRDDLAMNGDDFLWVADRREVDPPTGVEDFLEQIEQYSFQNLEEVNDILAGETAFYIYTSGTTGLPKAAKITHRRWATATHGFSEMGSMAKVDDCFYLCLPLYHGTGLICGFGVCVYSGASFYLRRKFSASSFWPDVQEHKITNFIYVGELCRYLIAQPPCVEERNNTLSRVFGNGLRPDIWDEFKNRFGIDRVAEFYGASEGNIAFVNAFNKDRTIGICGANILLVKYDIDLDRIVKDAAGKIIPADDGEVGLLLGEIDEQYIFDGYTDSRASESKILRSVVKDGDAWFNTGDLIKKINVGFAFGLAHYQFVDRIGDTYRWRSENVSTNEVEEILNGNDQLEFSNVFGVDVTGADGKAGMVAIVVKGGRELDLEEFSSYVMTNLPTYARPVFLRIQGELATTGTFKLVKGELRKQAYHLGEITDDLYFLPPNSENYEPLNQIAYQAVIEGRSGY